MTTPHAATAPAGAALGMSLRSRVLVGLALIAVVSTLAAAAVTFTTRSYLVEQLDDRLLAFSLPTAQVGVPRDLGDYDKDDDDASSASHIAPPPDSWTERPSDALRGALLSDGTFNTVLKPNVQGSDEGEPSVPLIDVKSLSTRTDTYLTVDSTGDDEYRILARPVMGGWEITGLSTEPMEAMSRRMVTIESLSIAAVLAGLGLVGWWVIRLGLTPMRRMVDASALIAEGDLSVRLDGAGSGTESAALAASLNTMIGRLSDSIKERERSEAKLRDFVADASHELRTPLTTVLGYAQLHRKGAIEGKAKQADAWARTEAEASRMKRLVEDMLDLARFDAEPQLHRVQLDATSLVSEVLADAARAHPEVVFGMGRGSVKADIEARVMVTADADRLRQAVINVVANAAQHGAEHITVTVADIGARASGARRRAATGHDTDVREGVRIEVIDDGPGMTPEIVARATERFVRGDSSRSRATGGAGLGLAITAAIVDAHRGHLTVASVLGEGTTVSIDIPRPPDTPGAPTEHMEPQE